MKRWKRDLGLVRELGPDTPAFDEAVQRVWTRIEELEEALETIVREHDDGDDGDVCVYARMARRVLGA